MRWRTFLTIALAGAALGAAAQGPPPGRTGGGRPPPYEIAVAAETRGPADALSGDGAVITLDAGGSVARRWSLAPGFLQARVEYRHTRIETTGAGSNPATAGLEGDYGRLSLSAFHLRPGRWTRTAIAGVESAFRDGAAPEDGLSGFALLAAQRSVNSSLSLGAGLLAALRLGDDPLVIPVPVLEYRWNAAWSVALERGLTVRRRDGTDTFFLAALPESHRYRLPDDDPSAPGGLLVHRRIEARLGWEGQPAPALAARLYAGAAVSQEFAFKDGDGRTLRRLRTDPALLAGAELRWSF